MRTRLIGLRTSVAIGALLALGLGAAKSSAKSVLAVPQDFPTIQSAIDAASDGDSVQVAPGVYFERIDLGTKAITVESTGGPAVTVIDGQQLGTVVTMTTPRLSPRAQEP